MGSAAFNATLLPQKLRPGGAPATGYVPVAGFIVGARRRAGTSRRGREAWRLLVRHGHGKRHDIAGALGFADLRRADALDLIDAHDGMHGYEAAHHAVKLGL